MIVTQLGLIKKFGGNIIVVNNIISKDSEEEILIGLISYTCELFIRDLDSLGRGINV